MWKRVYLLCGNQPALVWKRDNLVRKQANFACKRINFVWKHAKFVCGHDMVTARVRVLDKLCWCLSPPFVNTFTYQLTSRGVMLYDLPHQSWLLVSSIPPPRCMRLVTIALRVQLFTARRFPCFFLLTHCISLSATGRRLRRSASLSSSELEPPIRTSARS